MAHGHEYPDLVGVTRDLLQATGLPYVIENVPGAPLRNPIRLCGLSFGLGVKRHRLFETNFPVMAPPCGDHRGDWVTIFGGSVIERRPKEGPPAGKRHTRSSEEARRAMGINWMTRGELSQAIPPAYTEHVGGYLISHLQAVEKAAA
jgi:DNA (cytosine-5)-methyltransferase 1